MVNYLAGSNEAPEGFPGTAHAQEHMMFRGSPGLSSAQLADISAAMGGMFDADTQQTVTQYFFSVPAEQLDVALHIESIRMRGALDSEELWEKERGAIEQEVAQDLSDPEYVMYTRLLHSLFKGTVYAEDALGTRASFNQTTGAMLQSFYRAWYGPNNAILVIVGDVEPEAVLKEVKRLFGQIPARKTGTRPKIRLQPVKAETFRMETDLPVGIAMIAYRTPGYGSADCAATQVLADVLDSERGSLYTLVPEGKALSAGFDLEVFPDTGMGQAYAAFPMGADPEAVVKAIRGALDAVAKNGVPAELVETAKRREAADAEFRKNSVFELAMAWSKALAVEGKQSPAEVVEAMEKVSVDEVNRVARTYLKADCAVVAILTPRTGGGPVTRETFRGLENFAPEEATAVELPEWAQETVRRLHIPTARKYPEVALLPNGIKLITQPVDVSDTVSVFGHIENNPDLQTPPGKEGVDTVLDHLFSFGTGSLDRLAFQRALDEIAANLTAGTDFSLEVPAAHLERGVELLAANELGPGLPRGAFLTMRQEVAGAVAGELQSPGYKASRALASGLFPAGDPTLRQATPETVSSLTLEDVKDYHGKVFRPDMTTIVVIGKVDSGRARAVIEKHFGAWKAVGPKPDTLLPPVPLSKPSSVTVPDPSRVQDEVTLAQTLGLVRSDPAYYALELGNHVLGSGFYATRLYQDLREKTGLVYAVSSSFDVGRTRSVYQVYYGCDPPNVSKARAIIERDLKEMQTSHVAPERLHLAKAMLLRGIPLSESSVEHLAHGYIHRVKLGLPLNEPERAAGRYYKLSAEEVRAAFGKYVRPADMVQVTQGPNPP